MKNSNVLRLILCCGMLLMAAVAFAQTKQSNGQGSLTLWSCNAASCYQNDTAWALGKCENGNCAPLPASPDGNTAYPGAQGDTNLVADGTPQPINWNVAVQSVSVSANVLKVFGFMNIQNTGTANAYLGSLVINLQKQVSNKWVSAAADVTNGAAGDAATQANICSTADSENRSSFTEGAGSGTLQLYDQNHNDLTAFPQSLAPGASIVLLYEAHFNIDAIGVAPGQQVRIEAIVTFSNSGARGGSGASCTNSALSLVGSTNPALFTDINGDSVYTADEYYYRSVPCRTTITIPALTHENQNVTLSDPMSPVNTYVGGALTDQAAGLTIVNLAGSLNVLSDSTTIGGGTGVQAISGPFNSSFTVSASASATNNGAGPFAGGLDNCATLVNPNGDDLVVVNDPLLTTGPFTFTCAKATNLKACAWPLFGAAPSAGSSCSYSQGGWGTNPHGQNPGYYLTTYFSTVYPGGSVTIGGNGGPYSMTFSAGTKSVQVCTGTGKSKTCTTTTVSFTAPQAIEAFLPQGGKPSALNQTLSNPTTSHAGVFGGQVLALQLSVDFSAHGNIGWNAPSGSVSLGTVVYHNANSCENGRTVKQILGDANTLLGGGSVSGCTIDDLNSVVDTINSTFHDGADGSCNAIDGVVFTSN